MARNVIESKQRAPKPSVKLPIQIVSNRGMANPAAARANKAYQTARRRNSSSAKDRQIINNAKYKASPAGIKRSQQQYQQTLGYTPGGFDDPNIDWGKIYDIFVRPTLKTNKARPAAPRTSTSSGSDGMQTGSPAPAAAPKPVTTGTAQANKPSTTVTAKPAVTGTVKGNPSQAVKSFTKTGNRGTFGQFKRLRNQRSPRSGLSVTPEMLRRQAQARLLG